MKACLEISQADTGLCADSSTLKIIKRRSVHIGSLVSDKGLCGQLSFFFSFLSYSVPPEIRSNSRQLSTWKTVSMI